MTSRRRTRRMLVQLLPLLVLRALLPPGYMPVAEAGELRIVMCSAGLAAPTGTTAPEGAPDRFAAGMDCPFAHTPAAAPPPHLLRIALAPSASSAGRTPPHHELPPPTGPPRALGARAPPCCSGKS